MDNRKPRAQKRKRLGNVERLEAVYGYAFILPNFLAMLLMLILPILISLYLSMTNWDIVSTPTFIGLDNFFKHMVNDRQFANAMLNTMHYALIYIPTNIVCALLIGYLLSKNIFGAGAFRTMIFVPVTLSMVSVSMVWRWLLNTDYGVINWLLSMVGIKAIPWLSSEDFSMASVAIIGVWKNLGFNVVILIAAFKGVPRYLYESAALDGANELRKFMHISIPMISPALLFISVISVINSFQVFDVVYMTTKGGPGDSTRVIFYWFYQNAFKTFKMGYASAIAWVLFIIIFGLTMINMRFGGNRVTYDAD